MKNSPTGLRWVLILGLVFAVGLLGPILGNPSWGKQAVWAQEEKPPASAPEDADSTPPPDSSAELPHTEFLLDYVIVLALIAVALFAVCRSSRRV